MQERTSIRKALTTKCHDDMSNKSDNCWVGLLCVHCEGKGTLTRTTQYSKQTHTYTTMQEFICNDCGYKETTDLKQRMPNG
jgi:hypothetical protein